jgi:hypothetical protein
VCNVRVTKHLCSAIEQSSKHRYVPLFRSSHTGIMARPFRASVGTTQIVR